MEGIRYGLTGLSRINPFVSCAVIGGFTVVMTEIGGYLFRKIAVYAKRPASPFPSLLLYLNQY
ncbi:MAG: hypothetical protein WCF90_02105 [Methanomicrobiales archaeon]